MIRQQLPIDPFVPRITEALRTANCLILQASPGSGKTTRVPPALLRAMPFGSSAAREVVVLEPRRLAAKWAARRVADEMGERIGGLVGYQFRYENVSGPGTRLRFLTEGMLMRRLLGDPQLEGVGVLVLDEFHERHLHGDIALAYARWLQKTSRPDLRIVVMSATLETAAIREYLEGAPVIDIEAPRFPVRVEHLPSPPSRPVEQLVREAASQVLAKEDFSGDLLVFLPGMSEIRRTADALAALGSLRGLEILPLHGDLSREEQDRALEPSRGTKVILATNIAETSLTIPGVTAVIDSGLHRQASFSWWSGVPALKTRSISRASAIQRAGRAGRMAPGVCLRLYTKGDFDGRAPFDIPEVQRADLAQTVLELKSMGILNLDTFPWFDRPNSASLKAASELLYRLGALESATEGCALSGLGRRMASIPAHPRISRLLLESERLGVADLGAQLGAEIAEGELDSLDALESLSRAFFPENLRRAKSQLLTAFSKSGPVTASPTSFSKDWRTALSKAVLAGFPDRVARKRKIPLRSARGTASQVELVFSSGGSSMVEETGFFTSSDMFVVLGVQERQFQEQLRSQVKVRSLVPISAEWLFDLSPLCVSESEVVTWDEERQKVQALYRMSYDQLVLDESVAVPRDEESILNVLLRFGLKIDPERARSLSAAEWTQTLVAVAPAEEVESAFARLALFQKYEPGLCEELAGSTSPWELVKRNLQGKTSLSALREMKWSDALLPPELAGEIERHLPSFVQLPSGRRCRVQYRLSVAPWIESRLQDFFGMKTGPALLRGRLPLTLHLLAPNQRAVQVTTDLASFWTRSYPELRRQLSRRYPRHAWPEDPLKVEPRR